MNCRPRICSSSSLPLLLLPLLPPLLLLLVLLVVVLLNLGHLDTGTAQPFISTQDPRAPGGPVPCYGPPRHAHPCQAKAKAKRPS